jgi:hypothetical protein
LKRKSGWLVAQPVQPAPRPIALTSRLPPEVIVMFIGSGMNPGAIERVPKFGFPLVFNRPCAITTPAHVAIPTATTVAATFTALPLLMASPPPGCGFGSADTILLSASPISLWTACVRRSPSWDIYTKAAWVFT